MGKLMLLTIAILAGANLLPPLAAGVPTAIAANKPLTATKNISILVAANSTDTAFAIAPVSDSLSPEEQEFVARINNERTARGLNALVPDAMLTTIARSHSREMCDRNYFDHHSPTPGITTPMDRYLTTVHGLGLPTPEYALVGENIYYCSISTAVYNVAYSHQAFMNSPGHRANILEPRYKKVGVGTFRDEHGRFWVTEMFLRDTVE